MKQSLEFLPIVLFFGAYQMSGETLTVGAWSHTFDGIFSATAVLMIATIGVWLIKNNISAAFVTIPMFFMFTVTLASLGLFAFKNFEDGGYVLAAIASLLFVLAIALILLAIKSLKKEVKTSEKTA